MPRSPQILDVVGLVCPLPALKTEKAMRSLPPDAELVVLADDPLAAVDLPHLCRTHGYELVASERDGAVQVFQLRNRRPAG